MDRLAMYVIIALFMDAWIIMYYTTIWVYSYRNTVFYQFV